MGDDFITRNPCFGVVGCVCLSGCVFAVDLRIVIAAIPGVYGELGCGFDVGLVRSMCARDVC